MVQDRLLPMKHINTDRARRMVEFVRLSLCCGSSAIEGMDIQRESDGTYIGLCAKCKDHAQFVTEEEGEG